MREGAMSTSAKKHRYILGGQEIHATVRLMNVLEWNDIRSIEGLRDSLTDGYFKKFPGIGAATLAEANALAFGARSGAPPVCVECGRAR
jgi:DNA-directed RNA polymerase alpha subunit